MSLTPRWPKKWQEYCRIGYAVLLVSARTGAGLDGLKQALQGRTSLLLGKSGVGKTSLLNALQPGPGAARQRGQPHYRQGPPYHHPPGNVPLRLRRRRDRYPGTREFALWEVEGDDLADCFPEMRPFIGRCKFGLDCQHDEEPGCAVRRAVMEGHISPARYQSYMLLKEEP